MMTAFARTVILYFLIMTGLRLMGKRQIGELEPGELVLTMMISDLATVPMQDFGIPLLAGVIPILTLLALSMLMSQLSLHSLRFRALACGTPLRPPLGQKPAPHGGAAGGEDRRGRDFAGGSGKRRAAPPAESGGPGAG